MKKRTIMAIGLDFHREEFNKAIEDMEFLTIEFLDKKTINKDIMEADIQYIKENIDCLILCNRAMDNDLDFFYEKIIDEISEIPIIPIGNDAIEKGYFNINNRETFKINEYYANGGKDNLISLMYYIVYNFLNPNSDEKKNLEKYITEPRLLPFNGIFHNDTDEVFDSFEDYIEWYIKSEEIDKYTWVGILTHRSNWLNDNTDVEQELISEFEKLGLKTIPVFSYSSAGENNNVKNFDEIAGDYYSYKGKLIIDGLINLQMLQPLEEDENSNIFEQAVKRFKKMNILVFKPIISYTMDRANWEESTGLSVELVSSFTNPEMAGMIEPIIIGCRNELGKTEVLEDRVKRFTKRVQKWTDLRNTANKDKKIAIFIHNSPCSGVEATIGMGAGLDVFETVVDILKDLKANGYKTNEIPANGEELYEIIMNNKAYSDFRWTAIEDILEAKGDICQMPLYGNKGYMEFYNKLDADIQREVEETWGTAPGESMVYNNKLIITGVNFGNVNIMVQPKRGCYGAKCTGEVCKILHDPKCPPTHQYIATYKYVEEIFDANAVVHVGTAGSLEFLPGKTNGLSSRCYPEIVIGNLPNIYIYNARIMV